MSQETIYYATGRRKTAIARTWVTPGNGDVIINDRPIDDYFKLESSKTEMLQPFVITNTSGKYDVRVRVLGGGVNGQSGAIRLGIPPAADAFAMVEHVAATLSSSGRAQAMACNVTLWPDGCSESTSGVIT